MAKYTITLDECIKLFTPTQSEMYNTLLTSSVPSQYADDFKRAFYLKFRGRDVQAGTPAGFLLDLEESVICTKAEINALFDRYAKDGYFEVSYAARTVTETETPDLTYTTDATRTPNLTEGTQDSGNSTETPNTTNKTVADQKRVYSNTPDTNGVVSGNYATDVTNDDSTTTQTVTGNTQNTYTTNRTTTHTGTEENKETRTETGTRSRSSTETVRTPSESIYRLVKDFPRPLMTEILLLFSDCFILLY